MSSAFNLPEIFDLLDDLLPGEDELEERGYRAGTASVVEAIERCLKPSTAVLGEVQAERRRQDAKWGEQNHPDGTGPETTVLDGIGLRSGNMALARPGAHSLAYFATLTTNQRAEEGRVGWADILLEEVFEALAEDDATRLRTELIQVAAVATQWVETIDRRASAE